MHPARVFLKCFYISAGGRVMASCGKANLLLTSKFKQYRGLCYEYQVSEHKEIFPNLLCSIFTGILWCTLTLILAYNLPILLKRALQGFKIGRYWTYNYGRQRPGQRVLAMYSFSGRIGCRCSSTNIDTFAVECVSVFYNPNMLISSWGVALKINQSGP